MALALDDARQPDRTITRSPRPGAGLLPASARRRAEAFDALASLGRRRAVTVGAAGGRERAPRIERVEFGANAFTSRHDEHQPVA